MPRPTTPPFSSLAPLRTGAAALLRLGRFAGLSLAVLLVGCASSTAQTTPDLAMLADAVPVIEPIREARPYTVMGRKFVPQTQDRPHRESGIASWYGRKFHGRRTASGEVYDMHAMTAAHPTLPLPSYVRVRNLSNGNEVVVRVNDRGPFHRGRIIDLSYAAARKLGVASGVGRVEINRLTFDEIRTGSWRRAPAADGPQFAQLATSPATLAAAEAAAPLTTSAPEPLPGANPPGPAPATLAVAAADPVGTVDLPGSTSTTPVASVAPLAPPGFWVQLGVFKLRDGAEQFHRRVVADLHWLAPVLAVLSETEIHRLQAGPYRSRDEAHGVARRVREALSLAPMVVERY